jgi:hypothetical protein
MWTKGVVAEFEVHYPDKYKNWEKYKSTSK